MAAFFAWWTKPVGRGGRWRGVSASVGESAPGDLGAPTFHDLFREYFAQMTRLAHLLGADDAENVAQEAFVKLHQRWDSLTDHTRVAGYLRTIVVNMSALADAAPARRPADAAGPAVGRAVGRGQGSRQLGARAAARGARQAVQATARGTGASLLAGPEHGGHRGDARHLAGHGQGDHAPRDGESAQAPGGRAGR